MHSLVSWNANFDPQGKTREEGVIQLHHRSTIGTDVASTSELKIYVYQIGSNLECNYQEWFIIEFSIV